MLTMGQFMIRTAVRITISFILICGIGWFTDKVAMSWSARLCVDTIVMGVVIGAITMKPTSYRQHLDHEGV
jgi:hypothetical protein